MDINIYIGEQIKKLRERKNVTQTELAEHLKITPQALSRYERGERKIPPHIMILISEYLETPITNFFPTNEEEKTVFIPVYEKFTSKKPSTYIEIPVSWIDESEKLCAVRVKGNTILYKKEDQEYFIFEKGVIK